MARVFLASTYQDLKDYRDAVYVAVRRLGHQSDISLPSLENWASTDQAPLARTLDEVRTSHVVVFLVAWRYGYVPEGQGYSLTELELKTAREASVPCLVFMVPDDAPWPPEHIDEDLTKIRRLRKSLLEQFVVSFFTTPDELARNVALALHQWVATGSLSPDRTLVPANETPAAEVFLSYAHEDNAVAQSLAERISREKWSVFWDREIPVGFTWDDIVEGALDAAKCVVVLWTTSAKNSEWVRIEAAEGADRGILAPALIEETKIPLRFRRIQAANLVGWSPRHADTPGMLALISAIDRLVRGRSADLLGEKGMTGRDSPVDRIIAKLKNNPVAAVLIAIGTVVIALSTFTDGARILLGLLKGQAAESARTELNNLSAEYTPQAFVASVRQGDIRKVRLFLRAGMNPNAKDDESNTALMYAIAESRAEMIKDLLDAKADVNEKNSGGATALDWAAARGQVDTVRLLSDKGAGAETIDEAFISAAEKGHPDVMRVLLEKGARLNEIGASALLAAAGSTTIGVADQDRSETVKFLLSHGADVNVKNKEGWTGLLLAVDQGRTSIVQTLLDGGADVNAKCDCRGYLFGGWTALMMASREGRDEIVNVLVAKHAAADIRNNSGKTALALAAAKGDAAVVRTLLDAGADVNARDGEGRTPLMQAALEGNVEVAKVLLQRGARIEDKDDHGKTALQLARSEANADLVRMLTRPR